MLANDTHIKIPRKWALARVEPRNQRVLLRETGVDRRQHNMFALWVYFDTSNSLAAKRGIAKGNPIMKYHFKVCLGHF